MATVHPSSIDIAGTAWPVYKLEALAAGLVVCLVLGLITASPQLGVLVGASVAAARWLLGSLAARRVAVARPAEPVLSAS